MNDAVVGGSHTTSGQPIVGQSELATLMRAHDWSKTPLGPPHAWPEALKISVRIMLSSRQPIWIGWGPEITYLYNDAYKSIIGGKHPWALGKPTSQVWREIWSDIGPMLDTAMHGDTGTYVEEQLLIMERNGYPEETYYTYSYSPIPTADGTAGGIICANTDDTQRVISERQVALLRELAARAGEARSWRQACALAMQALATNRRDITFAALYMVEQGNTAVLVSSTGLREGHAALPASLPLDEAGRRPIDKVRRDHKPERVSDLPGLFGDNTPTGAWAQPSTSAVLLPITSSGETGLLFTDVGLPGGMNGRQLADEARRLRPDLKVLFTTGYARNAIVHEGRLDPGVALITKPFTYSALAAKLSDMLDTDEAPRVLLVEDEILVQMVAAEQLRELGYRVETAGSATEAMNKVKLLNDIDLAIVDVGLPDRRGDVLVGELRALHPQMPVVIATGYDSAELSRRFAGDPRIALIRKPYTQDDLKTVIGRLKPV